MGSSSWDAGYKRGWDNRDKLAKRDEEKLRRLERAGKALMSNRDWAWEHFGGISDERQKNAKLLWDEFEEAVWSCDERN